MNNKKKKNINLTYIESLRADVGAVDTFAQKYFYGPLSQIR